MADFTVSTVFTGQDKLSRVIGGMANNTGRAASRMSRAMAGVRSTISGVGQAAATLAKPLGVTAIGIGFLEKQILEAGSGFEEAISSVGAVGLKTREQIADLEAEALRLGSTTKFTATESANAMEIMAKAGFSSAEILGGVGGVLSAAAAGGIDIAEAADVVSNALKGMGMATIDPVTGLNNVNRVADVLAVASSKTNSSIGSLGESLKNVGSTASDLGIPLEQTVSAIALLQDTGLDASVAGSALNTMLTQIAAGNNSVAAMATDAEGNLKSLPDLLVAISSEMDKAGGNMAQVAFGAELVGLRGQKALSKLSRLSKEGLVDELTESLNEAGGAAGKMAALRMDNLRGDMTLLSSAVDGLKTKIFGTQSGPLRDMIKGIADWVSNKENIDRITAAASGFFSAVVEIGKEFGGAFMDTLGKVNEAMGEVFPSDQDNADAWLNTFKQAARGLGEILAIASVVAAGVYTIAAGMIGLASGVWGAIKGIGNGIVKFLGDIVFGITDWIEDFKAIFSQEGASFVDIGIQLAKHIGKGIWGYLKTVVTALPTFVMDVLSGAMGGFVEGVEGEGAPTGRTMGDIGEQAPIRARRGVVVDLGAGAGEPGLSDQQFASGIGIGPSPFGTPGGAPMFSPVPTMDLGAAQEPPVARSELVVRAEPGTSVDLRTPPPKGNPAQVQVDRSGAP